MLQMPGSHLDLTCDDWQSIVRQIHMLQFVRNPLVFWKHFWAQKSYAVVTHIDLEKGTLSMKLPPFKNKLFGLNW